MSCATADVKINLGLNICDAPLAQGIGEQLFLGRFAWLATSAPDVTQKKIIRTLTLNAGKKLLRYFGQNLSNQATSSLTTSDYGNGVSQVVRYVLFAQSPDEEAELDALLNLKDVFVIFLKNGNPGVYKIAGWKTGCRMTALSMDTNDATLKGAYTIELTAPDEKTTFYTLQHMSADATPVDDTATYLETLALAVV